MPELPDVEVFRAYYDATALHQRIAHSHVQSPGLLRGTSAQGLGRALKGHRFQSTHRHGKYLFAAVDSGTWLVLHFGMSGELKYHKDLHARPEFTCMSISFENGYRLAYVAVRKLGRIALTASPDSFVAATGLGPDVLQLGQQPFLSMAASRRGAVKSWLMDQRCMAGIGNIYSDEILFQSGIHPKHKVRALERRSLQRLYKAMRSVLEQAIEAKVEPANMPDDFLLPHREQHGRCPKCDSPLKTLKAAGRTAWYCQHCQQY